MMKNNKSINITILQQKKKKVYLKINNNKNYYIITLYSITILYKYCTVVI